MTISPSKVLYIKLGKGGKWEQGCIEQDQTLRFICDVPHELYIQSDWNSLTREFRKYHTDEGAATRERNETRLFYESGDDVLWVTFFGNRLWWCFSKPQVTSLPDQSRTRPVIGKWSSTDVAGRPLQKNQLSGKLLAMQGFRGTICSVKEANYLVQKINGLAPRNVEDAREALAHLEQKIEAIISGLDWKDFEVLIDLVFRQAGWQRVGELGRTQKTLDLDLLSPITSERFMVQIKAQANLAQFESYQQQFADMEGYSRFYFVVHTPLFDRAHVTKPENFELWLTADIARLAVKYGLAEWIIDKAG